MYTLLLWALTIQISYGRMFHHNIQNHPEDLDEALIRPGRIDQTFELGYIRVEEARQMILHYFKPQPQSGAQGSAEPFELTAEQEAKLHAVFNTNITGKYEVVQFTPAEVERVSGEQSHGPFFFACIFVWLFDVHCAMLYCTSLYCIVFHSIVFS
jgi:hypothetical protein